MTDRPKPRMSSGEEPLFVLKYRRGHVLLRILCLSLGALLFLGFALGAALIPEYQFHEFIRVVPGELVLALLVLCSILRIAYLLSFKEIRLYPDKIVEVRSRGRETEIKLADARFTGRGYAVRGSKAIHDRDTWWFPGLFEGIFYFEDLPHPKDAIKLNLLLAALSGRNVRDFRGVMKSERLIRKGGALRAIATSALDNLDNEVRWALMEEKWLNPDDRAGTVAVVVVILLPILCIAGWFIWIILT